MTYGLDAVDDKKSKTDYNALTAAQKAALQATPEWKRYREANNAIGMNDQTASREQWATLVDAWNGVLARFPA